jgi:hypothetical protein
VKYRKKPVVIDAIKYNGDNLIQALEFTGMHPKFYEFFDSLGDYEDYVKSTGGIFKIFTLEGVMSVSIGDYIIKGVSGESYPCKPDIFEKTYEAVE